MEDLMNAVRREVERVLRGYRWSRHGIVTGYHPDSYTVKVKLQPGDRETGWLPLASMGIGNGWGIYTPPALGDQVVVDFVDGHLGAGVVRGTIYSDEDRPTAVPAGEMHFVHKTGARLRFLTDGTIEVQQQQGTRLILNPDGSAELDAPHVNVGSLGSTFHELIDQRFQALFNAHQHSNVQAGSGTSGPPTQQLTSSHMTAALKGS